MQAQVNQFLNSLGVGQKPSANTTAAYRNDLTQFTKYVEKTSTATGAAIQAWQEVDESVLEGYLHHLLTEQEQEYASATVARKIAAVRSFFNYLYKQNAISEDPSKGLEAPKVKKSLPRPIRAQEVEKILAEPEREQTAQAMRDKALLETLYASGLRVSELINLDVADIDLVEKTIRRRNARKESQPVAIYAAAVHALQRYLDEGRMHFVSNPTERALFLNHRGQRLTRQGLWLIIKRTVKQADIQASVTPHTLRHSFAAHLLTSGAQLREVQERLGHANLSTTQVYRQISAEIANELEIDGKPLQQP